VSSPDPNQSPFAEQLTIETPEQTALEFPLAGIGSRFLALAFDTLFQVIGVVVLYFVAIFAVVGMGLAGGGESVMWVIAIVIILFFLLMFGYFAIFEALWNGQTPGKRQFKLRVIQDDGRPITVYQAISRNLLRIVDSLPGFYGVGIVVSLLGRQNKRLGDYVAGTVVVREGEMAKPVTDWTREAQPATTAFQAGRLIPEELQLIEAFLARRSSLDAELRLKMALQIAHRIGNRLGVPQEQRPRPEAFLEAVALEHRNSAGYR
jgi:uncharacterized RDD family membrane protein YckC